jgi:hypothetical protein
MQAETRTLTQLFQLDVRYVIPLYQRPYVWSEERQWAPLWEDIATVADHVFTEGASARSPSHFMGAIVIQQQENPPGSPRCFLVIDGQQRLTTLQLLLAAAARTAEATGCPEQAKLLQRLTANDPLLAKGEDRFKVWPTNANRAAFKIVMDPDGSPDKAPDDDPNNEIQEAYSFFCRQIRSWVTEDGAAETKSTAAAHFNALRISLSDLLKLVAIALATLAVFLDRLGRLESAATIAGFALSPRTASVVPQLSRAISHLRDVLGDQTYESLARKGETMTTAEMATYSYDQIDQARAELEAVS